MKILVISQHLFPMQTPRANRATELIKEFARQGHDVTAYAVLGKYDYSGFEKEYGVRVENIRLRWQFYSYNSDGDSKRVLVDKIMGKLFSKFEYPNIEFLYAIPKIIRQSKKVDLLISIADPHHIHWGVAKAKKIYPENFPNTWIADCGDPFMENGTTKVHYNYFSKFEKDFCKLCNFITVPHKNAINGYYPEFRKKIKIIPQGFNFKVTSLTHSSIRNKVITFAYAGVFLKDIRNPKVFLEFLSKTNLNFKFIIYTPFEELITPYKSLLGNKLEIRKPISRKKLLEVLKSMDFLLNLENLNTPTAVPSKLIDYAIIQKPILSIHTININKKKIIEFLNRNYTNSLKINNPEQYQINNVTAKFIQLVH